MKTLTLIGAGGKMGCRITNNVKHSDWKVHYVEVSAPGIQRLQDCGVSCSDAAESLPAADVVREGDHVYCGEAHRRLGPRTGAP